MKLSVTARMKDMNIVRVPPGELRWLAFLAAVLFLVAVYRWSQFTGFAAPPGSDGGQWLAFGHQLLSDEVVKAGLSTYPPVIPIAVDLASSIFGPMLALKLIAWSGSLLVAVPVYALLRQLLRPAFALPLASVSTVAPYHTEVLMFGGYPQLYGTAALVAAVYLLNRGLQRQSRRLLLGSAAATWLTIGTHLLAAMELLAVSAFLLGLWFATSERRKPRTPTQDALLILRWWLPPWALLSLLFLPVYWTYLPDALSGAMNPRELSLAEVAFWFRSSWNQEGIFWILSGLGAAGLALWRWQAQFRGDSVLIAIAFILVPLLGILATREMRFLELLEIGLILWIALAAVSLFTFRPTPPKPGRVTGIAVGMVLIGLFVIGTVAVGHRRTVVASGWYRVVDHSVMAGLDWLRAHRVDEGKVVAAEAPRGHLYGWWIEGYAQMPTYMVGKLSLFVDDREREQVRIARDIVTSITNGEGHEFALNRHDIRYLFLHKSDAPHLVEEDMPFLIRRFESESIIILEHLLHSPSS